MALEGELSVQTAESRILFTQAEERTLRECVCVCMLCVCVCMRKREREREGEREREAD